MPSKIDNKFVFTVIKENKKTILVSTFFGILFSLIYSFLEPSNYEYVSNLPIPSKSIPVKNAFFDIVFPNKIVERNFIFCENFEAKYDLINADYIYDLKSPVTVIKPTYFDFCREMNMGPFFSFIDKPIYSLNYKLYSKILAIDECWQNESTNERIFTAKLFSTNQTPDILNIVVNSPTEKAGKRCMNQINQLVKDEFVQALKMNIQYIEKFLILKNNFHYDNIPTFNYGFEHLIKSQYRNNQIVFPSEMYNQISRLNQNKTLLVSAKPKRIAPNTFFNIYLGLGLGFILGLIISSLRKLKSYDKKNND